MVEMELLGVQVEMPSNLPMMLLRETEGQRRVLPVYIDTPEARAIHLGVDKVKVVRPLTHDLMKLLLEDLGAALLRVTVTELRERTFYAELLLEVDGNERIISSRPSDAVALAVRMDAPIFASEEVLGEAGQFLVDEDEDENDEDGGESAADSDELLEEFKQFIDDVSPEDFES